MDNLAGGSGSTPGFGASIQNARTTTRMPNLSADQDLLARLIAIDSTSRRSSLPIAELICDSVDAPGITIDRCAYGTDKVNLVIRRGPTNAAPGSGLTLCGHMDVVPAEEPQWTGDAFTMRDDGDRLVGRGTCDMKGFVAIALNLIAEAGDDLVAPLCVLLTSDEELGSIGAKQFVEAWPGDDVLPVATIIGEPTSLRAVRMHKGHLKIRIILSGKAAHSGSPHLGQNAIEPAGRVIEALRAFRLELEQSAGPMGAFFPDVPFTVLTVARISGGDALNVIPERCCIELGMRLLPGEETSTMIERIQTLCNEHAAETAPAVEIIDDNPPMATDADAPIHRSLCELLGQDQDIGVSFASDAGALQRLGLQSVLFGPGDIGVAHRPDEFVPKAEMTRCRAVLEQLIDRYCRNRG